MSETLTWKCGRCNKGYKSLLDMPKVKLVETDSDVNPEHGFTGRCPCGYTFHKDKWFLQDLFEITSNGKTVALVKLSTVYLELNHSGYWYESMLFIEEKYDSGFEFEWSLRYRTRNEAKARHRRVVRQMRKDFDKFRRRENNEIQDKPE